MQSSNLQWQDYIQLLQSEVVPAFGCTEPVTVALASAKVREVLAAVPEQLEVLVTPNLYKNAMGVMVPSTGKAGLHIAAAIGVFDGNPAGGLEVLANVSEDGLAAANRMLAEKRVHVAMHQESSDDVLYTIVKGQSMGNHAQVIISKSHDHYAEISLNDEVIYQAKQDPLSKYNKKPDVVLSLESIYNFALNVDLADIEFIEEAATINRHLSETGLSQVYGLGLGPSLTEQVELGLSSDDLMTKAMRYSAAASDARMGGAAVSAMSNSGSGNQGIAATLPLLAFADSRAISHEQLLRALAMSHLCAIYVKSHQDKLSSLCAATTAAIGSSIAITWLLGGDFACAQRAVNNMIGDISGTFCDGAKAGCALKVSTGASSAIKAAFLAKSGRSVDAQQGIVFADADQSIKNLGYMSKTAMLSSDQAIIDVLHQKNNC